MQSNRRKSKGSRARRRHYGGIRPEVYSDNTECATQEGLNPELPSASQELFMSSGSDSLRGVSTGHSLRGQEDQGACCETTRENCDRDSEASPASLSGDSGFTSSQGNDSFSSHPAQDTECVSALRKLGFELDQERVSQTAAFPKRPGKGTLGRRIKLITNCYSIEFPSGNVYHYDIDVTRLERISEPGADAKSKKYRCLRTIEKRLVVERMALTDAAFTGIYPAYDGEKNLITRRPLSVPFPHEFTTDYEDGTKVRVRIKPVKKENTRSCAISLDAIHSYFKKQCDSLPKESIAALETILRHTPCLTEIPIGRSFFSPPGPGCQNPLSGGLEIWFGRHQSTRIGEWGPTVNLDVSATVFFPEGPLLDYMTGYLNTTKDALRRTPFLADRDRNRLNRKLKDRKVQAIHSHFNRKYTVIGLLRESAHNLHIEEGGPTVFQYFMERYGITLEFPNLPCLRVNPRDRRVYLPVELCRLVPGQHYNHELTPAQTSEMIKYTCSAPKQRFQKIKNIRRELFENDKCAQEFGLQISEVPLGVEGRTLDNPSLIYGSDEKIRPQEDAWSMIKAGLKFFEGAVVDSWALLAYQRSVQIATLKIFGSLLKDMGLKLGVDISNPDYIGYIDVRNTRNFLSNMKEERGMDLAVIVIPEDDDVTTYREVKKSAETVVGLITQCIRERTVNRITAPNRKCSDQLLANLFLKINAKMKGVNYSLVLSEIPSLLWKPIIVMGADVNHPGSYRGIKESLAAVSGSLDARCSIYAVRTMPQRPVDDRKGSTEIICDLQSMVMDLLRAFYKHTGGKKPEKIIFYRDGVSEGEFLKVRNEEVTSLRKACRDLGQDYQPGITYIVVQKRHHVRFMTERTKLNPPNGTVIDEGVTHPEDFDFFLFSQKSGKGTARPSHYTVLADDNSFTANDLQKFTNQLCFCNVRCTKSMSIPAPVAYAHLAAYRARKYLDADREGSSSSSSDSGTRANHRPTLEDSIESTRVVQEMKNRMYFV